MRAFIDTQDWITAYHLPSYAPDLNPVEGIWSILRRTSQADTAFTGLDHLIRRLRHGLRQIQHRSHLIDGCLVGTGLTLTTSRLQPQSPCTSSSGPVDQEINSVAQCGGIIGATECVGNNFPTASSV